VDIQIDVVSIEAIGGFEKFLTQTFSCDFLAIFRNGKNSFENYITFLAEQIKKGRVPPEEIEWRGKRVLTSEALFDPEGRLVGLERIHEDFVPLRTIIRREREGD